MDKNAVTGIVLITLLFIVWYQFFAPKPQPPTQVPQQETAVVEPEQQREPQLDTSATPALSDSLQQVQLQSQYSDFSAVASGEAQQIEINTDQLSVYINTKGGLIEQAELSNYKTFDSLPLPIVKAHEENEFYEKFNYKGKDLNTKDLYFTPVSNSNGFTLTGDQKDSLILRAKIDDNRYLEKKYVFSGDTYDIDYTFNLHGLQNDLINNFYELHWASHLPKTELSIKNMRQKSTIVYSQLGDVDKMGFSDDPEQEQLSEGVSWVSYKSQFFSQALLGKEPFLSANLEMFTPTNEEVNRIMKAQIFQEFERSPDIADSYTLFMGPNEYTTLKSYDVGLQKQMDLGWWIVSYINVGTVYIFKFLEKYIGNYGFIILIFALLIKVGLFPLTYKNYVSMAKLRVLNQTPEMKELDAKHKDDPQKLQMAKMGIYKEMGVSMFGGCLPMLLQYPFLIAMFFFFPQSVELRQKSFLWANDLSTYDSVLSLPFNIPFYGDHVSLFTILMAISTFVYTYFSQKSQPTAGNAQMKYIAYFMPVFLLVFLNNYASGLSLYYFAANLITIAQTTAIRYSLNDEKLLKEMRDTQKQLKGKKGKSSKKKGRIEAWMETQQKKQQQMARQRQRQQAPNRKGRRK